MTFTFMEGEYITSDHLPRSIDTAMEWRIITQDDIENSQAIWTVSEICMSKSTKELLDSRNNL